MPSINAMPSIFRDEHACCLLRLRVLVDFRGSTGGFWTQFRVCGVGIKVDKPRRILHIGITSNVKGSDLDALDHCRHELCTLKGLTLSSQGALSIVSASA